MFYVAGAEKPEDETRKANKQLCLECIKAEEEYKRLLQVVEQLDREYEDSKVSHRVSGGAACKVYKPI